MSKERNIHLFLTGPIRPSLKYVLFNVQRMKTLFGPIKTHILTWKTNDSDFLELQSHFDHVYFIDEPTDEEIMSRVSARTKQQIELKTIEHWTIPIYKMFYGLRCLTDISTIPTNDIIIRARTDLYIESIKNVSALLKSIHPNSHLFCPRDTGWRSCDWFSLSDFSTFKKIWYYPSDSVYNEAIQKTRCAETMITDKIREHSLHRVDINTLVKLAISRKFEEDTLQLDYRHDT